MPPRTPTPERPAEFQHAADSLATATMRSELRLSRIAAPENLAPYAVAYAADVAPASHDADSDVGTGRFVLLYDPSEPEAWGGPFRVVCFAHAPLEAEMGVDPFLADVAWSWLIDALDARSARYDAAAGTATKMISTGFAALEGEGDGAQIELRASWTPRETELGSHLEGWGELLCMLAGLPPATEGVTVLSHRRPRS